MGSAFVTGSSPKHIPGCVSRLRYSFSLASDWLCSSLFWKHLKSFGKSVPCGLQEYIDTNHETNEHCRYLWQKALNLFADKAIKQDFSNQNLWKVVKNMQPLHVKALTDPTADCATTNTAGDELGLSFKLGARGRMKVQALLFSAPRTSKASLMPF